MIGLSSEHSSKWHTILPIVVHSMRHRPNSCLVACQRSPLTLSWECLRQTYLIQHYSTLTKPSRYLQFAYELARQKLGERANAQAASNADLRYQQFPPSDLELVQQPHNAQDYPNNICTSLARSIPDSPSFIAGCPPNIERW